MRPSVFAFALPLVVALPHFPSTSDLVKRWKLDSTKLTGWEMDEQGARNMKWTDEQLRHQNQGVQGSQPQAVSPSPVGTMQGKNGDHRGQTSPTVTPHGDDTSDQALDTTSNQKTKENAPPIDVESRKGYQGKDGNPQQDSTRTQPPVGQTDRTDIGGGDHGNRADSTDIGGGDHGDRADSTDIGGGNRGDSATTNQAFSSSDPTPENMINGVARLNEYRALHNHTQGHEGEVPLVTWNNELAELAQKWADNCKWAHGGKPRAMGQNLGTAAKLTSDNLSPVMDNMYKEQTIYARASKDYTEEPSEETREKAFNLKQNYAVLAKVMYGHYAQMVWRETTRTGCAVSKNKCPALWTDDEGKQWDLYLIVCHYWKGGNVLGGFMDNVFQPQEVSGTF